MNARPPPTAQAVLSETRAWVERVVIGLNLCPFAKAPWARGQIRFVVSDATEPLPLLATLEAEMRRLIEADPAQVETTLLIHPQVLTDFSDYNDFLDLADAALEKLALDGVLQIASFHPDYQFAGTAPDDVSNATNRSPYPTLHLLREASVDRAVAAFPEAATIFEANVRTLKALGPDGWADVLSQCRSTNIISRHHA
ncbi:MAG TPA: DUF1415 domain-containing protein [Burkholderiaceae bacterium]|nr:DUF1415 domain-containing protein [Burkholderiaceae bacterium]